MKFVAKPTIEPLESRIAPARLIQVGAPGAGKDVDYDDDSNDVQEAYFIDTEKAANEDGDVGIAGKVGPGFLGVNDTYYLRLSKGDVVQMYSDSNSFKDYLTVKSGNIIAFFVDGNRNGEVDEDELTGIAMGKGASFVLRDGIQGDVVSNLDEKGTPSLADDELVMDGLVSGQQFINGVEVTGGNIGGSIIAGGNINFVSIFGTVSSILTGDAAQGKQIDFFRPVPGVIEGQLFDAPTGTGTINFTPAAGKAGGSIKNIFLNGLGATGGGDAFDGLLKAGGGGAGAAGGSISLVQIGSDNDGFAIQAGAGGLGTSGKGGAGGSVSKIYIGGTADATQSLITIKGGIGGNSASGAGGNGGALKEVFVGYRLFGSKAFATDDLLSDRLIIEGGAGGSGKSGGLGGGVTLADVRVVTSYFDGEEITVKGGAGGDSTSAGGKAGAGGSLLNVTARNQDVPVSANLSGILFEAGSGGAAAVGSVGGKGGSITNGTMLGWELRGRAGNGGDGKTGGAAGAISNITVEIGEDILANDVAFFGGLGGSGTAGAGGAGGNVDRVQVVDSDLSNFVVKAGDAGSGVGGKGGAGGSVQRVTVSDGDFSNGAVQTGVIPLTVQGGAGGNGSKGGGVGGGITLVGINSKNADVLVSSGAGGSVLGGVGKGGNAGSVDTISIVALQNAGVDGAFIVVEAGVGGAGAGNAGAGGAGGSVRTVSAVAEGFGRIQAGKGGDGQVTSGAIKGGAAGQGGSIVVSQITAYGGDGALVAGDAGAAGSKAASGGSVTGLGTDRSGVFAKRAILIQAGDGSHGGAGGSIKMIGYGSSTIEFSPAPFGDIQVLAGDGSGEGKVAGAGGSIIDVSGSLASNDTDQPGVVFTTTFLAGIGGSAPQKSGAGGSVADINILNGGYDGAVLRLQAGDAGTASGASVGAKGGDVKNVIVSTVGAGSIIRSIAAGNGGSASDTSGKGGAGGTIDGIYADGLDIGSRTDVPFGFNQMGGLFAGVGGDGKTQGINGKVANIVANGIGAIVAGRDLIPQAAESVSNIYINGSNTLHREKEVFVKPGPFRLAYTVDVTASESTAGAAAINEIQSLFVRELRASGVDFTFTFGNQTTPVIAGNASPTTIQNALNNLTAVQAAGGVTVTNSGDGFSIVITFNTDGDKTGLFSAAARSETGLLPDTATANDVEGALNSLPSIQYLGTSINATTTGAVDVSGSEGSFKITYLQNGNIEQIEGIEVFSSNLTELTKGFVDETLATESFPGSDNFEVIELVSGGQVVPIATVFAGDEDTAEQQGFNLFDAGITVLTDAQMQFSFSARGDFAVPTEGNATTQEVQTLALGSMQNDPRSSYTLTFNPNPANPNTAVTSIPLVFGSTQVQIQAALGAMGLGSTVTATLSGSGATLLLSLKFNATGARPDFAATVSSTSALFPASTDSLVMEAALETALNAMAPVKFTKVADRLTGAVDVEVVTDEPNGYIVHFVEFGDQQPLVLEASTKEIQEIDHSVLDQDPSGDFTLSFSRLYSAVEAIKGTTTLRERQDFPLGPINGDTTTSLVFSFRGKSTTALLNGNSTPAQIQTALNALGIGTVQVVKSGSTLQFTFPTVGDNPNFFTMTATSKSAAIPGTSDELAVQNTLNGLATIKGPSGSETVTVTTQPDGDFEVLFNTLGERDLIVAALNTRESQLADVRSLLSEATGGFRLSFNGQYTIELAPNADPIDVQNALNALSAITAPSVGGVTVTDGGEPGLYNIEFGVKGDQPTMTIRFEIDEVQNVDYTPGKQLTLGVNRDFTAIEEIQGSPALEEVQSIALGDKILNSAATTFTISYFNELTQQLETTAPLRGDATEAQIQQAIDDLDVFAPSEVDVAIDLGRTTLTFAFSAQGERQPLFSAIASDSVTLPADPSKTQVEDALNAMATVKSTGFGTEIGTVSVTTGIGSSFAIRFSSGGDLPMVTATQEQAMNVSSDDGDSITPEVQVVSPLPKGQPTDAAYAIANLIGFYSDHTELDANVFHYLRNGVVRSSLDGPFIPGDQPIDGLIFAKTMTTVNLTPEAYYVGTPLDPFPFYDWNNRI